MVYILPVRWCVSCLSDGVYPVCQMVYIRYPCCCLERVAHEVVVAGVHHIAVNIQCGLGSSLTDFGIISVHPRIEGNYQIISTIL